MEIRQLHNWNVTVEQAKTIQNKLAAKIVLKNLNSQINLIAGADVSYSKKSGSCFAAVTVYNFSGMELIEQAVTMEPVNFPYVPTYLTFREAPALLIAFKKLNRIPDLILFDGQGVAHPRRMGLATHLGIILDLPSIGCAKSVLVGEYEDPGSKRGESTTLFYKNQQIGTVLRTRDRVKPVFVSPGFKITLEEAAYWVLMSCAGYRIPEPIRQSHLKVNRLRIEYENQL